MKVYDTSTKQFVDAEHGFISFDHLVIFEDSKEAREYEHLTSLDREWHYCIMQKQELTYGNIMLCSWETYQMQMYFRCEGLNDIEKVETFLKKIRDQKKLKDKNATK